MTFNEIYEHVYGGGYAGMRERLDALAPIDRIAWRIYCRLSGRLGFDDWWEGLGRERQDDIFEGWREMLRDALGDVLPLLAPPESRFLREVRGAYLALQAADRNVATLERLLRAIDDEGAIKAGGTAGS